MSGTGGGGGGNSVPEMFKKMVSKRRKKSSRDNKKDATIGSGETTGTTTVGSGEKATVETPPPPTPATTHQQQQQQPLLASTRRKKERTVEEPPPPPDGKQPIDKEKKKEKKKKKNKEGKDDQSTEFEPVHVASRPAVSKNKRRTIQLPDQKDEKEQKDQQPPVQNSNGSGGSNAAASSSSSNTTERQKTKDKKVVMRPDDEPMSTTERTFIAIKPDGVQRGLVSKIIARFEDRGYKLVAMKLCQPSQEHLEVHYQDLKDKPFFGRLIQYMRSGPILAMVWEGLDAVRQGRAMLGATNPLQSDPGSIRGDFCIQTGRNICHGSDSIKSANREISHWFKDDDFAQYTHNAQSLIYE